MCIYSWTLWSISLFYLSITRFITLLYAIISDKSSSVFFKNIHKHSWPFIFSYKLCFLLCNFFLVFCNHYSQDGLLNATLCLSLSWNLPTAISVILLCICCISCVFFLSLHHHFYYFLTHIKYSGHSALIAISRLDNSCANWLLNNLKFYLCICQGRFHV